jgi:prepilin-type N-terminal cleavage/methylation domain-containing protein
MHDPTARRGLRPGQRRRSFTLIELIVVVIIIGVLSAIAAVAYNVFIASSRTSAVAATGAAVDQAITAQSATSDLTPSAAVAAALAYPGGLEAYFGVNGHGATYTPDNAAAPTNLTVTVGARSECLTLNAAPGQASTLNSGTCAGVSPAAPTSTPSPTPTPTTAAVTVLTAALTGPTTVSASWTPSSAAVSYTLNRTATTTSAAQFASPDGVVVDSSGNAFVTDSANNRIREISPTGVVTTFAGSGAAGSAPGQGTAATFNVPHSIAIDGSNNLYVTDLGDDMIRKITSTGLVSNIAGSGAAASTDGTGTGASFNQPYSIAVDQAGTTAYVTDYAGNRIRKITISSGVGTVTTIAGSATAGATNGNGTSAKFSQPTGIAVDPFDTTLYVAESGNNDIRAMNLTTTAVTTLAGSGAAGSTNGVGTSASFYYPRSIALDNSGGNLYVADYHTNLIRKIAISTRTVSTYAGSSTAGGYADGPSTTAALFAGPYGLGVDSSGDVWVAETLNDRIREINPSGTTVSTVAGSGVAGYADSVTTTGPATAVYSGPATSYTDTVTPGTVYAYTVTAADAGGPEPASNTVTVTP